MFEKETKPLAKTQIVNFKGVVHGIKSDDQKEDVGRDNIQHGNKGKDKAEESDKTKETGLYQRKHHHHQNQAKGELWSEQEMAEWGKAWVEEVLADTLKFEKLPDQL